MSDLDDGDDYKTKPSVIWDFSGPEPTWLTCSCGEITTLVPCWQCSRIIERRVDEERAREAAIQSIPKRYAWAQVNSPLLAERVKLRTPLADVVRRVLASSQVVFAGSAGSGKTSLAVACLRERLPNALLMSALRLGTARIQFQAGDGEAGPVERAIAAPLLLIDEVGGEAKIATNAVRDVVFARYDADMPTWITTGFTGKQIIETYGDGFLRRLTEHGYVVRLGVGPES